MSGRIRSAVSRARYASLVTAPNEAPAPADVLWSIDLDGDGYVCVGFGLGPAEFEVWLAPAEAAQLGAALLEHSRGAPRSVETCDEPGCDPEEPPA
jgi:hypothetical protein